MSFQFLEDVFCRDGLVFAAVQSLDTATNFLRPRFVVKLARFVVVTRDTEDVDEHVDHTLTFVGGELERGAENLFGSLGHARKGSTRCTSSPAGQLDPMRSLHEPLQSALRPSTWAHAAGEPQMEPHAHVGSPPQLSGMSRQPETTGEHCDAGTRHPGDPLQSAGVVPAGQLVRGWQRSA